MAGYCTLVLYFHLPVACENAAPYSCNIQPYYLLTHQIIMYLLSYTRIQMCMCYFSNNNYAPNIPSISLESANG